MRLPFANLEYGKVYAHHDNGSSYICLDPMHGTTSAELKTVSNRYPESWTFTAHDVYWHEDGTISWAYSTNGRFQK